MQQFDFIGFAAASLGSAALLARALWRSPVSRDLARYVLAVACAAVALAWPIAERAGARAHQQLQSMVEGIAPTYAYELEHMGHAQITLDTAPDDPIYLRLIEAQKAWLARNPAVADVYTFRKLADGTIVLVVDSETDYDRDGVFVGEREGRTPIGEVYDEVEEALETAFTGASSFSSEIIVDRWGAWVSAFVPMRDEAGRIESVCGVDFPADEWIAAMRLSRALVFVEIGMLEILALAAAFWVARARLRTEERSRAADVLAEALEKAKAADEAKSQFLAAMSHELRTPLNGVLGMAELMLAENPEPKQRESLRTIVSSVQTLLSLIGGVLDFSKGREGRIELEILDGDLREVARSVVRLLDAQARNKGIALELETDESLPARLRFDPMRVQQVLLNLVGNAIKFTQRGRVVVSLKCTARSQPGEAGRCGVELRVRDSGIGIPAQFLPRLFEPFSQADGSTARRFGGTGLGLAICKQLVELMGGRIRVESREGVGTEFDVDLALEVASAPDAQQPGAQATPTPKGAEPHTTTHRPLVLLVEDNRVNQEVALRMLARVGCDAELAVDGRAAIEALGKRAYDLVLLDGELPEMNGIEVALWVRERERERALPSVDGGAVPIIALTAHALDEQRARCLAAGMNDFLAKPFRLADLAAAIERQLPWAFASPVEPIERAEIARREG